jgi:Holliday junction resolvase RusA-like endonuclease
VIPEEYALVVPGKPVPWSKGAPPGKGPQVSGRQEHHVGKIRDAWERQHGGKGLWLPKGTPVRVVCEFYVNRAKSGNYRTGRHERELKPDVAPIFPTGKPDLSNLLKMVEDALTSVLWQDDDQVVDLTGSKRLIHHWEQPRSVIRVTLIPYRTVTEFRQMKIGEAEAADRGAVER